MKLVLVHTKKVPSARSRLWFMHVYCTCVLLFFFRFATFSNHKSANLLLQNRNHYQIVLPGEKTNEKSTLKPIWPLGNSNERWLWSFAARFPGRTSVFTIFSFLFAFVLCFVFCQAATSFAQLLFCATQESCCSAGQTSHLLSKLATFHFASARETLIRTPVQPLSQGV